MVELSLGLDKQKTVSGSDLIKKGGEILPKAEIFGKEPNNNSNEQYIAEHTDDLKKHDEILPDAAVNRENDKMYENYTWFSNSVNRISKWSKALKLGVGNSVGVESCHSIRRLKRE